MLDLLLLTVLLGDPQPTEAEFRANPARFQYGEPALAAINGSSRVLGYRLLPSLWEKHIDMFGASIPPIPDGGSKRIDGNLVIAEAGQLSGPLVTSFRAALTDKSLADAPLGTPLCGGFQPGVALTFSSKAGEATVLLCFTCDQIAVAGQYPFNMGALSLPLLRLSAQLFPGDGDLVSLLQDRERRIELRRRFVEAFAPGVAARILAADSTGMVKFSGMGAKAKR